MAICKDTSVNIKLIPVKMTYFFELAAVASLLPYLGVYMNIIGLTYSELSIIYGTTPFITAILRTFTGLIADKLQKHKLILMICCVASGLFHGLLLLSPKTEVRDSYGICDVPVRLNCGPSHSMVEHCTSIKPQELICINGNCTYQKTDVFQNATDCNLTCSFPDNSCADKMLPNLVLSECPQANSSSGFKSLILKQKSIEMIDDPSYGDRNNCSRYPIQNFIFQNHSYENLKCSSIEASSCNITCDGEAPAKISSSPECNKKINVSKPYGKTFWYFYMLFLIGQTFFSPVFSLIDAMVYDYLGKQGGKWGHQRLWGTVGFAIFAVISGLIMDVFTELELGSAGKNFIFAFVSFAVCSSVGGFMALFYKISSNIVSTTMMENIGVLLRRFDIIVLLINIFMFGVYTGIIETFLYVHLNKLGASKLLMGLCMLVNCLPEIPVLFLAGTIIRRLGYFVCQCVVYGAYFTRLFVYAYLKNPWFVLLVEPLHSITFGLMYATVSGYGNEITPAGMHGTIQSFIGALYFGFGKGFGSIISGQVYQYFGPVATFLGFGMSGVVFLILFILIHFLVLRKIQAKRLAKQKENNPPEEKEVETKMLDDVKYKPDEPTANDQNGKKTPTAAQEKGLMAKEDQADEKVE